MSLDLHPTSKYVASAGMDNVILLWDISKQSQPHKLLGHKVLIISSRIKYTISSSVPLDHYSFRLVAMSLLNFGKSISTQKQKKSP